MNKSLITFDFEGRLTNFGLDMIRWIPAHLIRFDIPKIVPATVVVVEEEEERVKKRRPFEQNTTYTPASHTSTHSSGSGYFLTNFSYTR